MHPPAVSVSKLSKSFPRRRPFGELVKRPWAKSERLAVLSEIDFTIGRGEMVGLLGPNGAGKTTLIKILCGLVLPETGSAEILGAPADSHARARLLGLVHGEERSFYWRLTARENLNFFARLHGLSGTARSRRVSELLERVELGADADRRFGDYSSGMRQRLAIARALLADPPVVLMDEPTRSLDPVSAAHLREWIQRQLHIEGGKTILIATHNLREAELLCSRVAILAEGRLRAMATPDELRRAGAENVSYRVRIRGPVPSTLQFGKIVAQESEPEGVTALTIEIFSDEQFDALLGELREDGRRVVSCSQHEADLESVFHRLVGTRRE